MKRILFAAFFIVASNVALALPQENNTPVPPNFVEDMNTLSAAANEMGMSALDSQETNTSANGPQEKNIPTP
jgi:hypothetical protein